MKKTYDLNCPLARVADVIHGKWTLLVLREFIQNGPRRFQDLQAALKTVPPNTLSDRLKVLEDKGLVTRELYENHPPRMRYILTESGEAFRPIMYAMREWGETYRPPPE